MSRLQVGGLALTLDSAIQDSNIGLIVTITEIMQNRYNDGIDWYRCENENLRSAHGNTLGYGNFPREKLMPLGDKQTQDQFIKEQELCHG